MKQYVIDAFTDKIFSGNPAAICILDTWIDESLMLKIAKENNLSETAFSVKEGKKYKLRWFTPGGEIDLCGHATLACAYVIMNYVEIELTEIVFSTLSGDLTVTKNNELYEMNFPEYDLYPVDITDQMIDAIGAKPKEVFLGRDLLCVFDDVDDVQNAKPHFDKVKDLDGLLLHLTTKGKDTDCISRSFAPKLGVQEDPVCGSGHCHIIPYWSEKLNKENIIAYQASQRGGMLYCRRVNNRIILGGKATVFSISKLFV